jgi:hypothetical protein
MDRVRGPIESIRFGQNGKRFFCAFEGDVDQLRKCDKLHIIIEPYGTHFDIVLEKLCKHIYSESSSCGIKLEIACDSWLELSLDFDSLEQNEIQLRFEIEKDGIIIQALPGYGELEIDLATTYAENWFI